MGRENREMLENFAGSFRPSLGCKFGSQKRKKKGVRGGGRTSGVC